MSKKPYRAEGWENIVVNDADGNTLVACAGATLEEAKANAALFAAAPDMFSALLECEVLVKDFPTIYRRVKAAINKATNV